MHPQLPRRVTWISLCLALCGCERDKSARDATREGRPAPGPDTTWFALARNAVTDYAALTVEIDIPSQATGGHPLPLRLVVHNSSSRPVWLETGDSAYAFDFVVSDSVGAEVWSRLRSRRNDPIPMIIRSRPVAAGDSVVFADSWNQRTNGGFPARPGRYWIRGILDTHEDRKDEADMGTAAKPTVITP